MIFAVTMVFLAGGLGLQVLGDWISRGRSKKMSGPTGSFVERLRSIFSGREILFFRSFFALSVVFIVGYYFWLVYAQYVAWRDSGPPMIYLVPPHNSIWYVFQYHFTRFLLYYLAALAVGLLLLWLSSYGNRKFGGRFFEKEEPYIGAAAIFLLGFRGWLSGYTWIFYLGVLVGLYLLMHIFYLLRQRVKWGRFSDTDRAPLYWMWLPLSILAIIVVTTFSF